jgi:hypothetical protein
VVNENPLRVKVFLRLICKRSILTQDVILHIGGNVSPKCMFYYNNECIDHLYFFGGFDSIVGTLGSHDCNMF